MVSRVEVVGVEELRRKATSPSLLRPVEMTSTWKSLKKFGELLTTWTMNCLGISMRLEEHWRGDEITGYSRIFSLALSFAFTH